MTDSKAKLSKATATVLIVDDHPAVREALAIRIAAQPDLAVCGEADDIAEALRLVAVTDPDVAIIDIALKAGNGIDLIKRLKAHNDRIGMIVWSMYGEELYAERAMRVGAMGYINKEHATTEIINAIRQVLAGKLYLSAAMSEKLLQRTVGQLSGRESIDTLSDRELEVFRLIGQAHKTQEIAHQLNLSVKTVETYRDRIREKLGLSAGGDLVRCALQWTLKNG